MSTILEKIEAGLGHEVEAARHAAAWLVGAAKEARQDVQVMENDNPLVGAAITAGIGMAKEHGVPVDQIVVAADDVLAIAKDIEATPAATQPALKAEQEPAATVTGGAGTESLTDGTEAAESVAGGASSVTGSTAA